MDKQILKMKKAPLEADKKKADELYKLLITGADKGQNAGATAEAQRKWRANKKAKEMEAKANIKIAKQEGKLPSKCMSNRVQNVKGVRELGETPRYEYNCHVPATQEQVNNFLRQQARRRGERKQKYINYGRQLEREGRGLKSAYADEQRAGSMVGDKLLAKPVVNYLTPLTNMSVSITNEQYAGALRLDMPQIIGAGAKPLISSSNMLIDDRNINGLNL